uniref:Uncharacterized protein n=1 Tax=Setaria viridis TaxID=4556 RepID=A0A4U6VYJ7_SETVI|nr:hypothetical protein SEVIR_2G350000v2 [Setaria viridis]
MSNVVRPDFPRLVPYGARRKYLMWASNVRDYLAQNELLGTIFTGTECSDQQKEAQALLYMRRHLNEDFRYEVSELKICDQEITDEEMIEKTLSTFPPSQLMLQLRAANFRRTIRSL